MKMEVRSWVRERKIQAMMALRAIIGLTLRESHDALREGFQFEVSEEEVSEVSCLLHSAGVELNVPVPSGPLLGVEELRVLLMERWARGIRRRVLEGDVSVGDAYPYEGPEIAVGEWVLLPDGVLFRVVESGWYAYQLCVPPANMHSSHR